MLMEEEHDPRRDGMGNFREAATDRAGHIMEARPRPSVVSMHFTYTFLKK
jgi:hypothetical protein